MDLFTLGNLMSGALVIPLLVITLNAPPFYVYSIILAVPDFVIALIPLVVLATRAPSVVAMGTWKVLKQPFSKFFHTIVSVSI